MLRLFITLAFTIAACVMTTAFFISGGPLSDGEVADIKAHLGRAYVEALGHAEAAARDARAEYCARHVEPACLPAPGY